MSPKAKPVLVLGYGREQTGLLDVITGFGFSVEHGTGPVHDLSGYAAVVSYGYRHILREAVIRTAARPPVNLHMSYLPYNRGANPNFWSFIDRTPAGVTIHEIDRGLDTGPIIVQKTVSFAPAETTFATTHRRLILELEALFVENIEAILTGRYVAVPQSGPGSYHTTRQLPAFLTDWSADIGETVARYWAEAARNAAGSTEGGVGS
jgi:methionyl-tRNA formyltransferase